MDITHEQQASTLNQTDLPARSRRGPVDYAALRQQLTIGQTLDLVGWQPTRQNGPQLRGPCPVHKSRGPKSRIFSVNTERNIYQCFKCGSKGNQLDLWVAVTGLPLYEAAIDLCDRLGIEPPQPEQKRRGTRTSQLRKPQTHEQQKD